MQAAPTWPSSRAALCVCSEKTFFRVENEFSHIAVDAPNVIACLNAVSTLGMAVSWLWYVEMMCCMVQSPSIACFCDIKNSLATSNSASIPIDCDRSRICSGPASWAGLRGPGPPSESVGPALDGRACQSPANQIKKIADRNISDLY